MRRIFGKKKKNFTEFLQKGEKMFEAGQFSEVLNFFHSLEPVDRYLGRQQVHFYTLQSNAYHYLGNYPKAHEMGEKAVNLAQNIKSCVEVVDALLSQAEILKFMEQNNESLALLDIFSHKIKELKNISEKDIKRRIGLSYLQRGGNQYYLGDIMKAFETIQESIRILEIWGKEGDKAKAFTSFGFFYMMIGKQDKSFDLFTKSQEICTRLDSPIVNIYQMSNFLGMAIVYCNRYESQKEMECSKKSLFWAKKYNNPTFLMRALHQLASVHFENEELALALEKMNEALVLAEKIGGSLLIIDTLWRIFNIYFEMGDLENATHIFKQIEQSKHLNTNNKAIMGQYKFAKAQLLSTSNRTRDLGASQEIFKSLIQKDQYAGIGITLNSILTLCTMLLDEFENSKNEQVLNEIAPLLNQLEELCSREEDYLRWTLAKTFLLKAKVSLIYLDFIKSRQFFTKAQQIAEKYGFTDLAKVISNEHDNFLHTLSEWNQMKIENVSISTRLEKIQLYDQIQSMRRKKQIKIPEYSPESPILLVIMARSGVPIYTKIIEQEWKVNEELFSSFLSAFNSFSEEVFSQQLDRANFGKYTILITGTPPIMTCYVFEGQSYSVQQKFSKFNTILQRNEELWKKFKLSERTGRVIQQNSNPTLERLVDHFLNNDLDKFQLSDENKK
ncbi:MAG: tetratricopeptide repeat protein [Promethearchaeota archaeon]